MRSNLSILARLTVLMTVLFLAADPSSAQRASRSFLIKLTPEAERSVRISATKQGVATGIASVDELHKAHQVDAMERVFRDAGKFEARHREFGLHRWYKLTLKGGEALDSIVDQYRVNRHVENVDRIRSRRMLGRSAPRANPGSSISTPSNPSVQAPNDPQYASQWQYNSSSDADIDLAEAWDLTTGSQDVIVAVLDSGADMDHPDLVGNLWVNPGEVPGNGIDDDNNGFVDDVNGWDFSDGDNNPNDSDGHGTHTAGTIAASTNNSVGVAGIAGGFNGGGARVMPLKIFENAVDDIIANAFVYAADNGAVISSNSWGGGDPSSLIENAIDYFIANAGGPGAPMQGGLVVFASGNDGTDDPSWGYPASYAPVMGVAASDQSDRLPNWSNYGSYVDITAPGAGIISTVVGGYDSYDGTSMACPHVAGVAALVASYAPGLTAAAVRQILEDSADNIDSLNPNRVGQLGSGRLNAFAALSAAQPPAPDHTAPGQLLSLTASAATYASVEMTWVATGDDGGDGRASRYEIRYSTSPVSDFLSADQAPAPPTPQVAGSTERYTLSGLAASTSYYVAVRAVDEAGNAGPIAAAGPVTTLDGPSISASPTAIAETLTAGTSTNVMLTITNTGSSTVSLDATASVRSASRLALRDIDPRERVAKERARTTIRRGSPITMLSGGSFLVWDPDARADTGELVRDALTSMGHSVDYTSNFGSIASLGDYQVVFVTLGMFPDNHVLTSGQGNALASYLDGGGALFMEGGDTWAYDNARAVHGYFGIGGLDDGSNDLGRIDGISGNLMDGASYAYSTDVNVADYVDQLAPTGGGFSVARNDAAGYDVGVAMDAGTYRTLGTSFASGVLTSADLEDFLGRVVAFLSGGSGGSSWVSVTPSSVSLAPGASAQLSVTLDASDLTDGQHEATISVASQDGSLRIDVPVTLSVGAGGGGGTDPDPPAPPPTAEVVMNLDAYDLLHLDGTFASSWSDNSGNGHDASQSGSRRPFVMTGWISDAPAVLFDGGNDYMKVANHADLNLAGSYDAKTLVIVAETGWDTGGREVIFEQGGASRGLSVYVHQDQLYVAAWNIPDDGPGASWGPVSISRGVDPYTLYTIALRLDGANGTLDARINGTSIGTESGAGTLYRHSGKIGLGGMWSGTRFHDQTGSGTTGYNFSGSIAALRYFNAVLSDEQIATIENEFRGAYFSGLSAQDRAAKRPRLSETPEAFELDQNYPNPFNPTTNITYQLPESASVKLVVFDLLGREVRTLFDGELGAGSHTAVWDGWDMAGRAVASGTYLYRLSAGGRVVTRSMMLLK